MAQRTIPSSQPGEEDDAFSLDSYVDLPDNGFMLATTSLEDLGPNPSNFASDAMNVSSLATGGSSMEVPSHGSDTTMTWIPRDMQINNTPQMDLSTAYLHFNGTGAGYTAHHPQHHASEVSTHHTEQHEGATNYPSGTGYTSTYQRPFFNPDNLLRTRSAGTPARTANRRLGPRIPTATTASIHVGVYQCRWEGCHPPRYFAREGDLWRHIRSIHVSPRAHACRGCGRPFGRKDHLDPHEARCGELRLEAGHML
ncbi:hypothetical protein ASPCAL02757 [Aspergillus calidoustus]|uniref:C2H2-type domain-containing protein n=1 Tax=Aspergillus calidoustus TaxID=454130 RepID=A0A0U5HG38_ASPCI|nr:hypothetical protein ASPCAL02757 [Aspergillus calidoustus]